MLQVRSRGFSAAPHFANAVFSFGHGQQGALGIGQTGDAHEPEEVQGLPADVVAVGAGHHCSFAVSAGGELLSWGRASEGQLGRALAPDEFGCSAVPAPVEGLPQQVPVVAATGSGVASFALGGDGSIHAWGSSKRGQLGLGLEQRHAASPQQLRLPAAAVQVSAGWGHAVALLDDGSVYTWGWPAAGRLGHSFAASAEDEEEAALTQRCCWEPRRVELLEGVRVRQVQCGFDQTLVLSQDGTLFTFGDNSLHQLGRPSQTQGEHLQPRSASAWVVNPELEGGQRRIKFRKVTAGLGHCLGVLADGSVAAWGWNAAGQCGLGQFVTDESIQVHTAIYGIPNNRHALIAAGRVHSVLATEELLERGSAFEAQGVGEGGGMLTMCHSWGSAANGRLGTGQLEESPFPEMIPDLEEQVVGLACGLDHTLILVQQR